MKRFLILLCLLLMICAVSSAETYFPLTSLGDRYDLNLELNEADFQSLKMENPLSEGELYRVTFRRDGLASVTLSIAPSELYAGRSLNDFSDSEIRELCDISGAQYADPLFETEITLQGNRYIHMCNNEAADIDSLFTVYNGYFIEMTICRDDFTELTEQDSEFCRMLLYGLQFVPSEV